VSKQNREPQSSQVQVEIQRTSDGMATALGIAKGAEVISRHERRFIDGTPWSMQTSYYPTEFADRGAERLRSARNIEEGTVEYLANTLHIRQVGYSDRITMRAPNPIEADFFKLPSDGRIPMYEITRTAYDGNGQPMRVTVTVYPTDRNQFIVEVGEVPDPKSSVDRGLAPT
jgi:GntR family transcriptional regulator